MPLNLDEDEFNGSAKAYVQINSYLPFFGLLLGIIFAIALLIKGSEWYGDYVYSPTAFITGLIVFPLFLAGLILAFIKKLRGVSAVCLLVTSYLLFFSIWTWALLIANVLAGKMWMIVGMLFAGVGVLPIAFIAALLHQEWVVVITIAVTAAIIYVLRNSSLYLFQKAILNTNQYDSDSVLFEDDLTESDVDKLAAIGKFFEFNQPLIYDAALLPYSYEETQRILDEKETELCAIGNKLAGIGDQEEIYNLNKFLEAIQSLKITSAYFTDINPEDRERVGHFNSNYKKITDIPEEDRMELMRLKGKYIKKATAQITAE